MEKCPGCVWGVVFAASPSGRVLGRGGVSLGLSHFETGMRKKPAIFRRAFCVVVVLEGYLLKLAITWYLTAAILHA